MRRFVLVCMALVMLTAAGVGATFASAADVDVTVSGGNRSCDELNKATGTISGAPEGATLEFVSPGTGTVHPAVINGNGWSVVFVEGTPPTTGFRLDWRVKVSGEEVDSGSLDFPACTPVTPPTPPVTNPPAPPVSPSEPEPPAPPAKAPAPSKTVAKTS